MTTWLSLKDAAEQLNVHPSTLRRWANKGDIPVLITPGGHRRFAQSEIDAFRSYRHGRRTERALEQVWSEQAISRTRFELSTQSPQTPAWMVHIDESDRDAHRLLGRQLMGLTLQYLSADNDRENFFNQAREIGAEYGRLSLSQDMPLADALAAMLFFRDTLLEVALELPANTQVRTEASIQLVRRLNDLLNEVHLAVAAAYQGARQS